MRRCAVIKQYLSTGIQNRSSGGFGCIASKGDISPEQAKQLDRFAAAYGIEYTDRNGMRIPITIKFSLAKDGSFAIGRNSYIDEKKPTHISHQFIFDSDTALDLVVSPDEMLRLPFASSKQEFDLDAQSNSVVLAKTPMPVTDLASAMRLWGIDCDTFCNIITAVYDCILNSRKLIIVLDCVFDDMPVECASLLYHIYRYLPYQMRMLLGFDTCYSYISSKSSIHISLATRADITFSETAGVSIGERNFAFDYVLLDGKLLHTADQTDCKCGILINGLKKYIFKEFSGTGCDDELSEVFDSIYSLSRGIPFGYFDNPVVYDAMFAAMTAVAGGTLTREQADPLLRFYIAASSKLSGDAADFWANAVYAYINDYESSSDDAYIITALAAIYCSSDSGPEYVLKAIQQKLICALNKEGVSAIKRFENAVASVDNDGSFYLFRKVFAVLPETEKAFISFKLSECNTAGEVCIAAASLAKYLGDGNPALSTEREITSAASLHIKNIDVSCDDIITMQRLLSNEIEDDVRAVIHKVADDALDKIDYTDLEPTWFMSIKLGGDFTPNTMGGATVMLLHDMLVDTSACDIMHYLSKYAYFSVDERINIGASAGDTIVAMLTDGRLVLERSLYPTVIMLTRDDANDTFDCQLIAQILSHHPSHVAEFIRYFGTKLSAVKDPSACFAAFLDNIKGICTDQSNALDVKEIIIAVNDVRKSGIKCEQAAAFNAEIYDSYNLHRPLLPSVFGKLTRHSSLLANSKSRSGAKYYAVIAAAIVFAIVLMLLFPVLNDQHKQSDPVFEIFSGNTKLEFVEYFSEQTDASERIKLAENAVNSGVTLSSPLTLKISNGDVKFLEYTQKNLLAGSESYTIGDFSNAAGTDDGVFVITLTNITTDLRRVYICFDVRYTDGKRICYGTCLQR